MTTETETAARPKPFINFTCSRETHKRVEKLARMIQRDRRAGGDTMRVSKSRAVTIAVNEAITRRADAGPE